MKPVNQTVFTIPDGNCLQACLASIFELPLESVPNFILIEEDTWWQECQNWCSKLFDVYPVYAPILETDMGLFLGYHLITVESPSGGSHVIVGYKGKPIHDPFGPLDKEYKITGYMLFVSTMEK